MSFRLRCRSPVPALSVFTVLSLTVVLSVVNAHLYEESVYHVGDNVPLPPLSAHQLDDMFHQAKDRVVDKRKLEHSGK